MKPHTGQWGVLSGLILMYFGSSLNGSPPLPPFLIVVAFYVDARLTAAADGRWLASADTPDGPSIGTGATPVDALMRALQPFEGVIDELLACLPLDLAGAVTRKNT